MLIQSYLYHESYLPCVDKHLNRIHDDVIVFRVKGKDGWTTQIKTIKLPGQWTLTDKLIKLACSGFELPLLSKGSMWHGPFIMHPNDVAVSIPPWEDSFDFLEVMRYLSNSRKPFVALIATHSGVKEISGKGKDKEEFIHLYLDIEEQRNIISVESE